MREIFQSMTSSSLAIFRFSSVDTDPELAKVLWLVKLRWLAAALFFALSVPGLAFYLLDRATMPIYIGIVGVISLFNFMTQLVLVDRRKPTSPFLICFQLAFDLVALWAILLASSGFQNPFVVLFLLNASLGGILIPGRLSWPFLALAHILLGSLQFQYYVDHPVYNSTLLAIVLASHVLMFAFWVVMRSLGAYLETQNRAQAETRARSEKQDRLRALGALAAGFSHEFASPLNSAKIRLERALRTSPTEDIIEALAAIESCAQVIHQMNSSQLDTREHELKMVNLHDLLKDIVESWREENRDGKISIAVTGLNFAKIPPLNFAQVVLNLLDNAEHAAPGQEIKVTLDTRKRAHTFSVSDQGRGFAPAILQKLGEPFVTNKKEGTGLGLYVSQLFAQSLGGDLTVQSSEAGGSRVTIQWPQIEEGK